MADDLNNRGLRDRAGVNVHERWKLTYWSEKFSVTPERLKEAVQKVG